MKRYGQDLSNYPYRVKLKGLEIGFLTRASTIWFLARLPPDLPVLAVTHGPDNRPIAWEADVQAERERHLSEKEDA